MKNIDRLLVVMIGAVILAGLGYGWWSELQVTHSPPKHEGVWVESAPSEESSQKDEVEGFPVEVAPSLAGDEAGVDLEKDTALDEALLNVQGEEEFDQLLEEELAREQVAFEAGLQGFEVELEEFEE